MSHIIRDEEWAMGPNAQGDEQGYVDRASEAPNCLC